MSAAVRDLFERYDATWAARDPDRIAALHTADSIFQLHVGQEPNVGREAIRAAAAEIYALCPDLAFEPVSLRVGDDYWVAQLTMTGAGGALRVDLIDLVLVEDGLVKAKHSYFDGVAWQAATALASATPS